MARLLRVRKIEEQVARATWAAAEDRSRRAEDQVRRGRQEALRAQSSLGAPIASGPEARQRLIEWQLLEGMRRSLAQREEQLLTLRGQSERLLEAWQERNRDEKALEKLEAIQRKEHRDSLEREETQEMDERARERWLGRKETPPSSSFPFRGPPWDADLS